MILDNLLQLLLYIFVVIATSYVSYRFGRKKQIDTIIINKTISCKEQICQLLQEIEDEYQYFEKFYEKNYGHVESLDEAIDNFERLPLFQEDRNRIEHFGHKREELSDMLKRATIYLKRRHLELVKKYLKIGEFSYLHDGGLSVNTFYKEFFKNLLDKKDKEQRLSLYRKIESRLYKSVK